MEKQLILDRDIQSQEEEEEDNNSNDAEDDEDNEDKKKKKMWFMVSGEWLFQWKCFISNKISSSAIVSPEVK